MLDLTRSSWKTASAGIVTAVVALIGFIASWVETGHQPNLAITMATVSAVVSAVGLWYARDDNKTSREVGATAEAIERDKEDLKELGKV